MPKHSNLTYKMMDEQFLVDQKPKEMLQYATLYWLRLQSLRPAVRENAEILWENNPIIGQSHSHQPLVYVNNILDIKPGQVSVIIGTLFKEMALKPTILKNVLGVLGTQKFRHGLYVGEEDFAVIEDSSGRVRIRPSNRFNPHHFVTGTILGIKAKADGNGFIDVIDYCYAGIPFDYPLPQSVNLRVQRDLYDGLRDSKRELVAFISGLEFGQPNEMFTTEMVLRFLRGELAGAHNAKVKYIDFYESFL